jgi:hypothetical protein
MVLMMVYCQVFLYYLVDVGQVFLFDIAFLFGPGLIALIFIILFEWIKCYGNCAEAVGFI